MLSQNTQCRHTIPAYTAKSNLYKKVAKTQNSGQDDMVTQQNSYTTRRTRTRGAAEQAATTP